MTDTEIRRIRVLEWLYDQPRRAEMPCVADMLGDEAADEHVQGLYFETLQQLQREGLIMFEPCMGGPQGWSAMINEEGTREVEQIRDHRKDPSARNAAARTAVLKWLYAQPPGSAVSLQPMLTVPASYFLGKPFEMGALDEALTYLKRAGLVEGNGHGLAHSPVRLTQAGIDCVEEYSGVVSDYKRGERPGGGTTVNFHGNVSGNVAWQNQKVQQAATTTGSGFAGDELLNLLTVIREAMPALGLTEVDTAQLIRNIDAAQSELEQHTPDAGIVKKFVQRTLDSVSKAGSAALGAFMVAHAESVIRQIGS